MINTTLKQRAINLYKNSWNLWVLSADTGDNLQKVERQNYYAFYSGVEIEKFAEDWKTRFELSHET
ncbi:hypothetical protein FH5T_15865 [Draconibacterium orientale]|uniref:Uncharacterized protein n=1 Tax=Draconibacterium orientale TaxID=1168034 RepID=A0ABM5QFI2_9BACT|nr:hypothetical protein FH5T_15865 [Draconibacterium orientale]